LAYVEALAALFQYIKVMVIRPWNLNLVWAANFLIHGT